jgi:hypothetical protein
MYARVISFTFLHSTPNSIARFSFQLTLINSSLFAVASLTKFLLTHNIFLFIRLLPRSPLTAISPLFFSWHLKHVLKTVYNLKVHVETTMKRNKKQANLKHKFNSWSLKVEEKKKVRMG